MSIQLTLITRWQKNKFEFINKQTRNNYIFLWFMQSVHFVVFRHVCTNAAKGLGIRQIVGFGYLLNQVHNIVDVYLCLRLLLLIRLIVVLQLSQSNSDCLSFFLRWFIVNFIDYQLLQQLAIQLFQFSFIFDLFCQTDEEQSLIVWRQFLWSVRIEQNCSLIYKVDREYYIIINMYQEAQSGPLLQSARQNFVKKVYSTLSLQLLVTVFVVYMSFQSQKFLKFLIQNTWFFWTNMILSVVSLLALYFGNISKKVPINYAVMGLFTLCESFMVAYICMYYEATSVLLSAVATLSATLGLTYFAMTTKQDFTSSSYIGKGVFYSLSWIVLSVSLINIFFLRSSIISMGVSIFLAVVYSVYLLIDTQAILGNGQRRVGLDDYILGATIIYVDIISLFLKILRLLGKKKDD